MSGSYRETITKRMNMTFNIAGFRITLFKFERLERFTVQVDQTQRKNEAEAIKNSERFQAIKQQAQALRSARNDR